MDICIKIINLIFRLSKTSSKESCEFFTTARDLEWKTRKSFIIDFYKSSAESFMKGLLLHYVKDLWLNKIDTEQTAVAAVVENPLLLLLAISNSN